MQSYIPRKRNLLSVDFFFLDFSLVISDEIKNMKIRKQA